MSKATNIINLSSFLKGTAIGTLILAMGVISTKPQAYAWNVSHSAESICWPNPDGSGTYVHIKVSFTNNDSKAMKIVAHDNWTDQEVVFDSVAPGESKTGEIKTGTKSISHDSSATFTLTWADGSSGSETKTSNYSAKDCPQPAAPSPTPAPTTPPASTPIPTPTNTPNTPTPNPTNPPTTSNTTTNVTINVTNPTPTPSVLAANITPPKVLGATTVLGKTGTFTQDLINTIGVMSATAMTFAGGLYAKFKGKKLLS